MFDSTMGMWRAANPPTVTTTGPARPPQLALVAGRPRPQVDRDDAQAVEGVADDRRDEGDLAEAHDRVLVRADDRVVRLGERRISAVSSTCTSRKKKMATPVMRCSTHDHMPSLPR
jgi:hypothetical protein